MREASTASVGITQKSWIKEFKHLAFAVFGMYNESMLFSEVYPNMFIILEAAQPTAGLMDPTFILMIVAMFAIMYFLMIRPENKRKKKAEEMRNSLSIGDEITTIGGMTGKIVQVTEDTVTFETGEDRVRIQAKKWAIQTTAKLEAEEAAKYKRKK